MPRLIPIRFSGGGIGAQGAQGFQGSQGVSGVQGQDGLDFLATCKWILSNAVDGADTDPDKFYFKLYNSLSPATFQLAISSVTKEDISINELFTSLYALNLSNEITVTIVNVDDASNYATCYLDLSSISPSYISDGVPARIFTGDLISSSGSFVDGDTFNIFFNSKGDQGFQGSQGSQGATGASGSQGAAGANGSQGAQGSQGSQGTNGGYLSMTQLLDDVAGGNLATPTTTGTAIVDFWTTNYTSSGGSCLFTLSFSSFTNVGSQNKTYEFLIDDIVVSQTTFFFNETNVHLTVPTSFHIDTLPAGPHSIKIRIPATTMVDLNDRANLVVVESKSDGSQGPQGFQGAIGAVGSTGTTGATGLQGAVGSQGQRGFQGFQGEPGGSQGAQGFQGTQGFVGLQGLIGNQGLIGTQGFTGVQGDPGGAQGAQGFQGFQGESVTGSQGEQGVRGFQGYQGNTGLQGSQGSVGLQGSQGFQGFQGNPGFVGAVGSQGSQGSQGFQGFQGASITGAQGNQGIQGSQGSTGLQGSTGTQGGVGSQGFQGFQGNSITGSQGSQGFQGYQGPAGAGGGGGGAGYLPLSFFVEGAVLLFNGTEKHYVYKNATITSVTLTCQNAPTGADIRVRIRKNGTAISYTDPADSIIKDYFTLADGTTFQQISSLGEGVSFSNYLTIDVIQAGSTYPGYDLTVYIISEV